MTTGPCNVVVYLGSGEEGISLRRRVEKEARDNGYVKKGKVKLAPYIRAVLEGRVKPGKTTKLTN